MENRLTKLRKEVPRLEQQLEQAIIRRRDLEQQVERLTSEGSAKLIST